MLALFLDPPEILSSEGGLFLSAPAASFRENKRMEFFTAGKRSLDRDWHDPVEIDPCLIILT